MSKYLLQPILGLIDPATKQCVGIKAPDGLDYFFGVTTTQGGAGPVNPSNVNITGGTMNNVAIGALTPAAVKASSFQSNRLDTSGTPGNATINYPRGRAAFAAAGSSVTITNNLVTATSTVLVQVGGSDATLTTARVTPGTGSFVVTGNAAATATTPFDFFVVS